MTFWRKTRVFLLYASGALALVGAVGVVWAGLIVANLKVAPRVPWCLPAIVLALRLMWLYLGGRGWPRATATQRKTLLRATAVPRRRFAWSLLAGGLGVAALGGCWIVAVQLFQMPPNPILPQRFSSSPTFVAALIIGASLVAPITEESAMRGYLQSVLEREFSPPLAVALSSAVFAVAHVSQGVFLPKLGVYFLAGVLFGTLAFANDSILPVLPVHAVADLTFFLFIWPHDQTRDVVWRHPADAWFWLHAVQAVGCSVLFVLALRHVRRLRSETPGPHDISDEAPSKEARC